jgi:hypothetical protein
MKQDRFLLGILIGIFVLVLVALGLFFTRHNNQEYLSADTPEAVVFNYVLAVTEQDYEKAYGYLADLDHKPTYDEFRQSFFKGEVSPNGVGVDVGKATVHDGEASVELNMLYSASDPFSTGYTSLEYALLVQQGDEWRISSMPYMFWSYNWYQPAVKP